jgi:putative ABC transport system substrate-binding protein
MKRREFITLLGGAAAAWPLTARAQQPATQHRIAIFHPAIPTTLITETGGGSAWRAFFAELRRLGYIEGENLIVERYSAEGHHERYANLAREIVTRKPRRDRLQGGNQHNTGCCVHARSAESGAGHQPGPTRRQPHRHHPRCRDRDLGEAPADAKRSHPFDSQGRISGYARRVGRFFWASLAGRRRRLGISLVFMLPQEGTPSEIERVFAAMEQQRPDAVLVSGEGDLYAHRQLIVELAEKNRLPAMCPYRDYVEAGGLMAYAVDLAELLRRMADDVHQILKGAKPGDIPIYQPTKFELLINLKTAKALGLSLPPALLALAAEIIE